MPVDVVTFGCRLNTTESEVIRREAKSAGLEDCVIFNTCAVTGEAVRQARQTIRRMKRESPSKRFIVTGCAAQTEPETFAAMPEVDHVLGNQAKLSRENYARFVTEVAHTELDSRSPLAGERAQASEASLSRGGEEGWRSQEKLRRSFSNDERREPCERQAFPALRLRSGRSTLELLRRSNSPDYVRRVSPPHPDPPPQGGRESELVPQLTSRRFGIERGETSKIFLDDIMAVRETCSHMVDAIEGRARAFVQIQNGCDHRCTFCIIPFGRGPSRSVPMGAVVEDVRRLVANGYNEVVLTGVDITSYGAGLPGAPKLGALVKSILKHVPELARLRLSSIDSIEADSDLIDAFANEPRLMPHLHLSLQAGDDMILKRMKRRHLRKHAIEFCAQLKRLRPEIVFGADLIAGFPTETEEMFENSLRMTEECELTHLHVFPYSKRKGTPAARMPQLSISVIKERAARLREKGIELFRAHLKTQIGTHNRALVEHAGQARIEQFTPILVEPHYAPGSIVSVRVIEENGKQLIGEEAASYNRSPLAGEQAQASEASLSRGG